MLQFEGDKDFPQEPGSVWNKLSDAAFLVQCIPDASVEGTPTRTQAKCTVRPGLSFVRGTLDVTLQVTDAQEPGLVNFLIVSKGIGANSEVEAALTLTPQPPGTHLHWRSDIRSLGGLLKMVPSGLIRGAAQKVIDDVWASIQQRLADFID